MLLRFYILVCTHIHIYHCYYVEECGKGKTQEKKTESQANKCADYQNKSNADKIVIIQNRSVKIHIIYKIYAIELK